MIGLVFSKFFENNSFLKNTPNMLKLKLLPWLKKGYENDRHYASKVETLVKQGWYNEYPSTINLKCNDIFTRGLPEKNKRFR